MIATNRRGRKRKQGPRYPSGGLIQEDARVVVLAQPHRRHLPVIRDKKTGRVTSDKRLDQKAATALGSLNLLGAITDEEHEAGQKYASVFRRYWAVIEARDPLMRPAPGNGGEIPPDEAKRRKEAYNASFEAMHNAGQRSQRAVAKVAIYDHPLAPPDITLPQLRRGLQALVIHYGLTAGRKSVRLRNE